MKWAIDFIILFSLGCATTPHKDVSALPLSGPAREEQEREIHQAIAEFEQEHYEKSLEMFQAFRQAHPESPFYRSAEMGEAKSFIRLGKWSEALPLYEDIIEATRTTQPEIAADALYQRSFCYEALGDETKLYATLLDSKSMRKFLPDEVALAEIPARLAASYYRMGRVDEAQTALQEAEAGIQQLKVAKGENLSEKYLADIYFQMGSLSTNQLSLETFQSTLNAFQTLQIFLLRSVELNVPSTSELAAQNIKNNYRDFAEMVSQVPLNRAANLAVARRDQTETKTRMSNQILGAMEKIRQSRMPGETAKGSGAKDVFAYLKNVEARLLTYLNSRGDFDELTPEAKKLNGIKKNILMKADPVFPNERK